MGEDAAGGPSYPAVEAGLIESLQVLLKSVTVGRWASHASSYRMTTNPVTDMPRQAGKAWAASD
jgi:hypothetical protein